MNRFEKYFEEKDTNPQKPNKDKKEKIHIGIDSVPPAILKKRPELIKIGGVHEIKHRPQEIEDMGIDLQNSIEIRQEELQQLLDKQQQIIDSGDLKEIEQTEEYQDLINKISGLREQIRAMEQEQNNNK